MSESEYDDGSTNAEEQEEEIVGLRRENEEEIEVSQSQVLLSPLFAPGKRNRRNRSGSSTAQNRNGKKGKLGRGVSGGGKVNVMKRPMEDDDLTSIPIFLKSECFRVTTDSMLDLYYT